MQHSDKDKQAFIECGGQCEGKGYSRSIEIENNEEGRFRRLSNELEAIGQ